MRDAVILAVLGMGTVLILLFVINLMIVAIGKLFGPKETKKIENPKQARFLPPLPPRRSLPRPLPRMRLS